MAMMRFGLLFRELAIRETRTMIIQGGGPSGGSFGLPPDEYGFDEMYCDERGCDCRRVILNVLARNARRQIATISHAFDPPAADARIPQQTFLDPINRQSRWAPAVLDLFVNVVLADENYCQRLERHYRLFKERLAGGIGQDASRASFSNLLSPPRGNSIPPPPPRRGHRKKWR